MKKTCSKCEQELPNEEFAWKNKREGTKSAWCKPCYREYDKARWQVKSADDKQNKLDRSRTRADSLRQLIWDYLKVNPCPCGETDPVVLEFDHRDGVIKKGNVCEMVARGSSVKTIIDEIAKCDVLCANCHRRKTATQFGWYSRVNK